MSVRQGHHLWVTPISAGTNCPKYILTRTHRSCSLPWTARSIQRVTFTMESSAIKKDPRGSVTDLGRTACQPHLRIPAIRRLFGGRLTLPHAHHSDHTVSIQQRTSARTREFHVDVDARHGQIKTTWGWSMRKRASPVATGHAMGEFMDTWPPHHRLNAGIIGVGKQVYYQAPSHGCPGLVDFSPLASQFTVHKVYLDHSSLPSSGPHECVLRKHQRKHSPCCRGCGTVSITDCELPATVR